jgi:hypothetical protein
LVALFRRLVGTAAEVAKEEPPAKHKIAIIVHGGAWDIPLHLTQPSLDGCDAAADAGFKVLAAGGSAMDAVEASHVTLHGSQYATEYTLICVSLRSVCCLQYYKIKPTLSVPEHFGASDRSVPSPT